MRNYTKIQKTLSFLLIFSILFSFSINITFFSFVGQIFAWDATRMKVVSIFVQEEIYNQVESEVKRYASDIQWVLADTRTMIIPVSSQEHPYNIASLIEKLYFEWYTWIAGLRWESKLIGSVFVWDIPLPIVENQWSFEKTVFPYTDFENKLYVFQSDKKRYQLNPDFIGEPKVEIWHGFISPNTGDMWADITQIQQYFDKNHDFYTGAGNYQNTQDVMNGVKDQDVSSTYEPFVLYYDQVREFQALNYVNYKAYEQYWVYKEDIAYDRYSKQLADVLQWVFLDEQAKALNDLWGMFGSEVVPQIPSTDDVPDILTRHIIKKAVKKFPEVFNTDVLWQFRKDVHNAGRYNGPEDSVNVDLIPQMIGNMDVVTQSVLKNANFDLEKEIDQIVQWWLARNIALLTDLHQAPESCTGWEYVNFFYGQQSNAITSAQECSFYRWNNAFSWQLVESNRAYNVWNVEADRELCLDKTQWYWGGNSPMNIDSSSLNGMNFSLNFSQPNRAILPLFDIQWQKKSLDNSKVPSPLNCYNNSLILVKKDKRATLWNCREDYKIPVNGMSPEKWSCETTNQLLFLWESFDDIYPACSGKEIFLDGRKLCGSSGDDTYEFKQITSWVEHKSPTQEELIEQVKSQVTPNLAIDKNRYIDFIAASWEYAKIEYPFLFRLKTEEGIELSFENILSQLEKILDEKSAELNQIISQNNPSSLSPSQKQIYDLLKNWNYPQANIDLYEILSQKPSQEVEVLWAKKSVSYIEMLALSLYWNNLPSVSSKYQFIYEYQFGDQMLRDDFEFFLPKNRSLYEMSYMVVPGDAKNMYVKMDGEDKWENPYADIIAKNLEAQSLLKLSQNSTDEKWDKLFKCAPPDGVPITEWLPAVNCWIEDLLPPKIEFKQWNCWLNTLFSFEDSEFYEEYSWEWMLAFLESQFAWGKLKVSTDSTRCNFNSASNIEVWVYNKDDVLLEFDNYSNVQVRVKKIEIPFDPSRDFSEFNKITFFDLDAPYGTELHNDTRKKQIQDYIMVSENSIRLKNGQASIPYTIKNKEANIELEVFLVLKDQEERVLLQKTQDITLQVRDESLQAIWYQLSFFNDELVLNTGWESVEASNLSNIFIVTQDTWRWIQTNLNALNALSAAQEKLFFTLTSKDKNGQDIPLEFPIQTKILKSWEIIKETTIQNISQALSLWAFEEAWNYSLHFLDSFWRLIEKDFSVVPSSVAKIDVNLGTNLKESGGVVTQHMFALYDAFDNIVSGTNETVEVFLEWNSLTFEDATKSKVFQVYEWFKKFNLLSTSQTGNTKINFVLKRNEQQNLSQSQNISVVESIKFDVEMPESLSVGENTYDYTINVQTPNEVTSFASRAYLITDWVYVKWWENYISIENNTGVWRLQTTTKATEKVLLQWYIEWVKETYFQEVSILPWPAVGMNVLIDKPMLEAKSWEQTQVRVQLQDRYGNTVFSDNSTQVESSIDEKYQKIISLTPSSTAVQKWEAVFIASSTQVPWSAFFKVSASWLSDVQISGQSKFPKSDLTLSGFRNNDGTLNTLGNTFFYEYDSENYRLKFATLEQLVASKSFQELSVNRQIALRNFAQNNDVITIAGVNENVGNIQTFYFWNKDKIQSTHHNVLYATLLWGNYWDITQKDVLWNSLLFEPTSKTLWVTSLLGNLKKQNEIVKIWPNGTVQFDLRSADLSQDITQSVNVNQEGKLEMSFFNNTFSQLISRIFVNIPSQNLVVKNCTTAVLSDCYDSEKNTIGLYTISPEYIYSWNEVSGISLKDISGKEVFGVSRDGKISKASYVHLSLNNNYKDSLGINIEINGKNIALLGISLPEGQVSVLRILDRLSAIENIQPNGWMIVYLDSIDYAPKTTYLSSDVNEQPWLSIVYNDPFASDSNQYSHFLNHFDFWYEFALKHKSRWWEKNNKTLLSFAAWKSVWEATKDYASFSLINLWDPVVSLKPIKQKLPGSGIDRKFDATIGELISLDRDNLWFTLMDYNADGKKDVAILKREWFVELLEATSEDGEFFSRGNIVHMTDIHASNTFASGDFSWNGYWDIVTLNSEWKVVLFENSLKNFNRRDIHDELWLNGKVLQLFAFDMDNDGKHDLVIYDESGEINIFYWGENAGNLQFTRKNISSWWWVQLSSESRNDGWIVYFDGMYQVDTNSQAQVITSSEDLMRQVQNNVNRMSSRSATPPASSQTSNLNESALDNMMFVQVSYTHPFDQNSQRNVDEILSWDFIQNDTKTFLRSEYAENEWIAVVKTFTDTNGWSLQSGDEVSLDIEIENISWRTLRNIAYLEKLPDVFQLDTTKLPMMNVAGRDVGDENVILKKSIVPEFAFLIDEYNTWEETSSAFVLNPGQKISLKIPLTTRSFQAWYIEVGLFEAGEPWDDVYGDIAYKTKKEACWAPSKIWRSIAEREYQEWVKEIKCESTLPDDLAKNQIDLDGNGIPDYIDELMKWWENFQKYAEDELSKLLQDTDWDGIPDDEDWSPYFNDNEDFLWSLDTINATVDDIVGGMDALMRWFSCGFGGWSCLSLPMNWAPLAPWNDPVLFGMPVGDGLSTFEWLPAFSAVTMCGAFPWVWPPCSTWAGWMFGYAPGPFRLFVTPTLTWAVWVAMCFGDNVWSGYGVAPWVSPLTPGWNCIVYAKPIIGCKNDGNDGEIYNVALPGVTSNGFGVIHGNCNNNEELDTQKSPLPSDIAWDYLYYKKTGIKRGSLEEKAQEFLWGAYLSRNTQNPLPNPLITAFDGNSWEDFSLSVDFWSLRDWDFWDVVQMQMSRVAAFPDFLMEWVRRQIEEIVNKLTAFPTLFVVLPDFSWIFDGFQNFWQRYDEAFQEWVDQRDQKEASLQTRIDSLQAQKDALNCNDEQDKLRCLYFDIEIANLTRERNFWWSQTMSGIRGVYEFLGNLPMISIVPEQVNVNIPWIDESTLNKAILEWELTRRQWSEEWERVKTSAGWNQYNCVWTPSDPEECRIIVDIENLISSLDKNIEILHSYKKFPEEFNKLLRIKELRLEQILCNVEIISEIVWGWIGDNGKRFRAWVDLFILVKAILKSWQVFIDIFLDYEAECHQCKNERNDLQYFIWKIISGVIPSMPIVQFPKWPDIYMDLHNIRVGMTVAIPDFHFNVRPILLPSLPNLYLPDAPYVTLSVPSLPILPEFQLPELPDLPSLPSIELPDLPPPPKLPRLFASLEWVLNILKLITKAMCILKFSPFVPEWRAWDQIAFMTERSGFLPTDFLDLTLPQFSFPVVDAIKVSTYVNLEFETEFLTEAARQITLPLNIFTNNVVNLMNVKVMDLDFTAVPTNIDVNIDSELDTNIDVGYTPKENISLFDLGTLFAQWIPKIYEYLEKTGSKEVSTDEFKQLIVEELAKSNLSKTPAGQKLTQIWSDTLQYSFEKENELIEKLQENNSQKFTELETILNQEIQKNKQDQENLLENILDSYKENVLISSTNTDEISSYNRVFDSYNTQTLTSALWLLQPDENVVEIRNTATDIQRQIDSWLNTFESEITSQDRLTRQSFQQAQSQVLAMNEMNSPRQPINEVTSPRPASLSNSTSTGPSSETCSLSAGSGFRYQWFYVVEKLLWKDVSYRLFDYIDELRGDETIQEYDEHLIYMNDGEIYFKRNLLKESTPNYSDANPIVVRFSNTWFETWSDFVPAVNNFEETISESGFVNMRFQANTDSSVNNYRIQFYDIVDKLSHQLQEFSAGYLPNNVKKYVIDAFSNISEMTQNMETLRNAWFTIRRNLATFVSVGNFSGIQMSTRELINIREDIVAQKEVIVNSTTPIYAGRSDVTVVYYLYSERNNSDRLKSVILRKNTNIQFNNDVVIASLTNDAYIAWSSLVTLRWNEILSYLQKPLFPGTKIWYAPNERTVSGTKRIEVEYYDGSIFEEDFQNISWYEIRDLWNVNTSYSLRVGVENDFYYATIQSFANNKFSSLSNQILLSPQKQADKNSPEISWLSRLRIPVYQKQSIDITDYIYENSGITNIVDIFIDMDLSEDSTWDGNLQNDRDVSLNSEHPYVNISKTPRRVFLEIGPYEEIFTQKIRLFLVDTNANVWYKDIDLEIYPPVPNISRVEGSLIVWNMNESLKDEPISLYRMRGWNLTRLQTRQWETTVNTQENGDFTFIAGNNPAGLVIKDNQAEVARVNEFTGKIDVWIGSYSIVVYPTGDRRNTRVFPQITLMKNGVPLYSQHIVIPDVGIVQTVNNFIEVIEGRFQAKPWVYVRKTSGDYETFTLPTWIAKNAWDMIVYKADDRQKQPIATIYKDGRIELANEGYFLQYSTFGEYVVLSIFERWTSSREISQVLLIPEWNFVVQ